MLRGPLLPSTGASAFASITKPFHGNWQKVDVLWLCKDSPDTAELVETVICIFMWSICPRLQTQCQIGLKADALATEWHLVMTLIYERTLWWQLWPSEWSYISQKKVSGKPQSSRAWAHPQGVCLPCFELYITNQEWEVRKRKSHKTMRSIGMWPIVSAYIIHWELQKLFLFRKSLVPLDLPIWLLHSSEWGLQDC